jgi:hypothetical protein
VSSKPNGNSVCERDVLKQVVGCLSWKSDAFSSVESAFPLRYQYDRDCSLGSISLASLVLKV